MKLLLAILLPLLLLAAPKPNETCKDGTIHYIIDTKSLHALIPKIVYVDNKPTYIKCKTNKPKLNKDNK